MLQLDNSIEEYLTTLQKNGKQEGVITCEALITNCIVTSKKLIIEIESLEDMILKTTQKDYNKLLILGTKLELLIREMKEIIKDF